MRGEEVRMAWARCATAIFVLTMMSGCQGRIRQAAPGHRETFPETRLQYPELRRTEVALGLDSGPSDWNGDGRDDGVVVTLIPKDQFGDTVKTAGAAEVLLHTSGLGGFQSRVVANWPMMTPAELNDTWIDLTFSGYRMRLGCLEPVEPTKPVKLEVRFATSTGKVFRAEKTYAEGVRR